MKGFLSRISPRQAFSDFRSYWGQPTPHRWKLLGVAAASTFAMFVLFVPDNQRMAPPKPEVYLISTFAEDRTEAEIIASNCANQQLQDELQALIDANEERKRELYKTLGRATFIDVDAMEAEAERERAAEEARDPGPTDEELALSVAEYCARASAS